MSTILVVDDEQGIREVLQDVLSDEGHQVVAVEDGFRCLEVLENETIDLVILDVWLPNMGGIAETDTLQFQNARRTGDEKHICPLQLGTIERCIKLWSNPGEVVFTPFMGIGSECYQALRFGRKAMGIELKPSYFEIALLNLKEATIQANTPDLFAFAGIEV